MVERKIGDIQILRAVAIILVLLQHLSLTSTIYNRFPNHGAMPFWSGVELFFVISGLVVTKSVFSRNLEPLSFFLRRVFRLWPAILFFLAFSAAVLALAGRLPPSTWGADNLSTNPAEFLREAAGILGGYYINQKATLYVNDAMWSLAVEFQFYAAYALWILICVSFKLKTETAKRATIALASILYALALIRHFNLLTAAQGLNVFAINYIVIWRFEFMLVGVIISSLNFRPRSSGPALAILALLIPLILASMCEDPMIEPKRFLDGIGYPLMGALFGYLVLIAKSNSAFHGQQTRLYAIMYWIGDRSFSIYLLHFPVMALQWMIFFWFLPSAFSEPITYGLLQAGFVLPVTAILSDISFRYIETPGRDVGKRLLEALGRRSSSPSGA